MHRADAVHVEGVDHGGKLTVYYCDQVKTGGEKHERADACSRERDDVKRKRVDNVDLIVYGIGPAGILSSLLSKEVAAELEPAYDENVARPALTPLSRELSKYVDKRRRNEVTEDKEKEEQLVTWYKSQESAQAFVGLTARKHKLAKEHRGVNRRAKSSSLISCSAPPSRPRRRVVPTRGIPTRTTPPGLPRCAAACRATS